MTIITRARAQEIKNYHSIITRGKAKKLNYQNTIVTETTAKSLKDSYSEEEIKTVLGLFDESNKDNDEKTVLGKEIYNTDTDNTSMTPLGYLFILFIMSLNVWEYMEIMKSIT